MEKITHNGVVVYKTTLSNIDNKKVIEESNLVWNLIYPNTHDLGRGGSPGVQFGNFTHYDSATSKLISQISNKAVDLYKSMTNEISPLVLINPWMFISSKRNKSTNWHDHIRFVPVLNTLGGELKTYFTAVYYVNLPEIKEERILYLKEKEDTPDEDSLEIYPEVGDIYIFDAKTPHMPALSKKSKNTRYVLGINFYFVKSNLENTEPKIKFL